MDRIQQRRDTAARWAQYNPVLLEGEVGYVTDDPNQYKIGDGVRSWNDLPLRGYTGTIVQETGSNENAVMSQKATTETTILPVITYPQTYVDECGMVNSTKAEIFMSTEYVLAKEGIVISGIQRQTTGGYNTKLCFYDKYRNFISSISEENNDDIELTSENIPSNAVYFIANLNITNGVIYSKHRVYYQDYIEESVNPYISIIKNKFLNKYGNVVDTQVNSFAVTDYYYVVSGIFIKNCYPASSDYIYLCFYDKDKNFISSLASDSTTQINHTIADNEIPQDAMYFRVTVNPETYVIVVPQNKVFSKMLEDISSVKTDIELEQGYNFIDKNGQVISTTLSSFLVTKPIIPKAGMVLYNVHPVSGQEMTVAAFYDVDNLCVGLLAGDGSNPYSHILQDSDIPNECVYMRVTVYPYSRIGNFDYYTKVETTKKISDKLYEKMSFPIKNSSSNCYLSADGKIMPTTVNSFLVSDFCPAKENFVVVIPHRASSAADTIICFYDKNFKFISNITTTDPDLSCFVLTTSNIPMNAAYFRATVWNYGYVDYRVPISDILNIKSPISNFGYFDYNTALSMNRSDLVEVIEAASNGRCTALYDDDGYPSLMYKIPKVAIGALAPTLGDLNTVHPAFIVGGVEKDYIYVSVFETSLYEGHYVSWFGLEPVGNITIPNLRTGISNKGDGWHLETIYERSLIVLLTNLLNSPTPTGNTANGMSHVKPWEYCQREGGYLPGIPGSEAVGHTGLPYINGTQPSAWSHNKEQWGIQDVIGGFHRICYLYKLINGKIYLSADNRFFKKGDDLSDFEDSWFDTGAAFDFIDDNIVLNTSVTNPMTAQYYVLKKYSEIGCTSDYDTLSLDLRKKLALLLLCSRVSSSDIDPVFGFNGRFGIANHKPLCYGVFGGAQEYPGSVTTSDTNISGLGAQITAYSIDDNDTEGHNAHYNMGSRIVYIE